MTKTLRAPKKTYRVYYVHEGKRYCPRHAKGTMAMNENAKEIRHQHQHETWCYDCHREKPVEGCRR